MIGGLMGGTWLKDWQNSKKRSANSRENQKARLNRVYMSGGIPKYQEGGWTDFVKSTLGLSLILGSAATLGGASTQDAVLGGLGGGLLSMGALGLFRYMTEDGTKAGQAFTPTKRPKTILQKAQNPLWFMNKALNPFASLKFISAP